MMQTLRKPVFLFMTILVVASLVLFSFAFTVRYNEKAVVTSFGSASDADLKTEAGLKFKWPYPFQSVTSYDTRLQIVDAVGTQQQTADDKQIIVEAYAIWRVHDPLDFYTKFSNAGSDARDHYSEAESTVRSSLNSAISETSRYRMDDLFTDNAGSSQLGELEAAILALVQRDAGDPDTGGSGIEIVDVGINRIRLSEQNSKDVIERMKADRVRLAQETIDAGAANAQSIRSRADKDAQRILSFANLQAKQLKAAGDLEAGEFIAAMQASPELATLLAELQFLRDAYSKQITLVVSGAPGFRMLQPSALEALRGESDQENDK
jgi:membrane protease subunit HflC